MKRYSVWVVLLVSVLLLLTACQGTGNGKDAETTAYFTVAFDSNGGAELKPLLVADGTSITEPTLPAREGYVFAGWLHEGMAWDFRAPVEKDMTLVASWISTESLFSYERIEGTDTAVITGMKGETKQVVIPERIGGYEVVAIGKNAFAGLWAISVEEIVLPKTVHTVGEGAFSDIKYAKVTQHEEGALRTIGEGAFSGCLGLEEIRLAEGLETIPFEAFSGCVALKSVTLPKSLRVVEENAFEGCTALLSVTMGAEIERVEDGAFHDCDRLVTIFLYGTEEEAEAILDEKTAGMNDPLTEATVYLYSETKPETEGAYGYWYLDSRGRTKIW